MSSSSASTPRARAKKGPGSVYLVASGQRGTLKDMAQRALADAAGGHTDARPLRVAVTYAAADGPLVEKMSSFITGAFEGAKVERFTVHGERRAMAPEKARAIIDAADLVFVGGGDPVAGARLLVASGADAWIRAAHARGTPCVGVSAGSIMLCGWWAAWPDDPDEDAPHHGGELVSCTRVLPDLVVDCHAEHDKWEELKLVRGMLRDRLGEEQLPRLLGLPTGTGIIVAPDGSIESVGGPPYRLR
jgi:cyanophycinase-like exopeptidase